MSKFTLIIESILNQIMTEATVMDHLLSKDAKTMREVYRTAKGLPDSLDDETMAVKIGRLIKDLDSSIPSNADIREMEKGVLFQFLT